MTILEERSTKFLFLTLFGTTDPRMSLLKTHFDAFSLLGRINCRKITKYCERQYFLLCHGEFGLSRIYNAFMNPPLLTILIPTRNRPIEIHAMASNLIYMLRGNSTVEILISDNSDYPIKNNYTGNNIRIVRPKDVLDTAEENLFFGLSQAQGTYIWPLGDDDIVLKHGLEKLLDECKRSRFAAFTMNTRNVSSGYQTMGWSRVVCFAEELEISYGEFLERMGFWSIPAGISLTVFKKELISEKYLSIIKGLKSKIYSHVTFFALIFKDEKFAFINTDLVEYRTNTYDVNHSSTNHWTNYSSKLNYHDRFFWLNGFIEHLELLEKNDAISSNYIARSLDIGHFNHRIPLLEHMLTMLIDQTILDLEGESIIQMSNSEVLEVLDYFVKKAPELTGFYQLIRSNVTSNDSTNEKLKELTKLKDNWSNERQSYPFRRYYYGRVYGFFIYDTPLGWLALSQSPYQRYNEIPMVKNLQEMLMGIDFPKVNGVHSSQNREDLYVKISGNVLEPEAISEILEFQRVPILFKSVESIEFRKNLLFRVWHVLPERLKHYVRKSIYGK